MPEYDDQLAELKHSYQVLGVPTDAAPPSIKHAYRQLVRRWHPDFYVDGTPDQIEATHMAGIINKAYAAIAHAPLRDYVETYTAPRSVEVSESSYEEEWGRYRSRRNKIFTTMAIVGLGSVLFLSCIDFADKLFGSAATLTLMMLAITSSLVVMVFAPRLLCRLPCPRCHNNFFGSTFGPFNGRPPLGWNRQSCAYCGLPRRD
jgi:DnaJ domain